MYQEHQPLIARYAAESPLHLLQVGLFVQSTINQHLEYVPVALADIRQHGRESKFLSRYKKIAYDALLSEAGPLYHRLQGWRYALECQHAAPDDIAHEAIFTMLQFPGFGIVKSAFWVQLCLGLTACLDRWNLRKAGLKENVFERIPASTEGILDRIATYIATCTRLGGSAALWNQWCETIHSERPEVFASADAASQLHVECICVEMGEK